ncbi:hypothetical protein GCM10025780_04330 [Frondihabitans cladoniiphilus]|uniref:Uncharacterized protein n=1 Tax=Frondihabitans cladoniiphilus TaxID=715785 RepID=A0ABP8VND1_9MICO
MTGGGLARTSGILTPASVSIERGHVETVEGRICAAAHLARLRIEPVQHLEDVTAGHGARDRLRPENPDARRGRDDEGRVDEDPRPGLEAVGNHQVVHDDCTAAENEIGENDGCAASSGGRRYGRCRDGEEPIELGAVCGGMEGGRQEQRHASIEAAPGLRIRAGAASVENSRPSTGAPGEVAPPRVRSTEELGEGNPRMPTLKTPKSSRTSTATPRLLRTSQDFLTWRQARPSIMDTAKAGGG